MTNPRRTNGHRRNQLRQRVLATYDTCALCGTHVDTTLGPHRDESPEVDEITPVSLGGDPYAWDNVQLVHRACNLRKGNGTTSTRATAPLTTSRTW